MAGSIAETPSTKHLITKTVRVSNRALLKAWYESSCLCLITECRWGEWCCVTDQSMSLYDQARLADKGCQPGSVLEPNDQSVALYEQAFLTQPGRLLEPLCDWSLHGTVWSLYIHWSVDGRRFVAWLIHGGSWCPETCDWILRCYFAN